MHVFVFLFLFSGLSFLLSFLVLGWMPDAVISLPPTRVPPVDLALPLHEAAHVFGGALVALPARRGDLILACAAAALLIDVDHVGWMAGLPMIERPSHSIPFMLVASAVMWYAAKHGWLGAVRPRVAAATAAAATLAHVAVEAWTPFREVPIFSPLHVLPVQLGLVHSAGLVIVAACMMWFSVRERRKAR